MTAATINFTASHVINLSHRQRGAVVSYFKCLQVAVAVARNTGSTGKLEFSLLYFCLLGGRKLFVHNAEHFRYVAKFRFSEAAGVPDCRTVLIWRNFQTEMLPGARFSCRYLRVDLSSLRRHRCRPLWTNPLLDA